MTIPNKISNESEALIDLLIQAAEAGRDEIPYEELSGAAGLDVTEPQGRGYLATARNRVQQDRGEVWGTRRGQGLYLVPHGERARVYQKTTTKVRGECGRATKVMNTVDHVSLTDEEREAFNTGSVVLSLVKRAASKAVARRIEDAAKSKDVRVVQFNSVDSMLDFLKRARGKPKDGGDGKRVRPEPDTQPPS